MKPSSLLPLLALCALLSGCGGGSRSGGDSDSRSDSAATEVLRAPANVTAVPGDERITLSWDGVAEATHYNIYRATESGVAPDTFQRLTDGATERAVNTPVQIGGLQNGITYYFVVTAVDSGRESDASDEAQSTPTASSSLPAAPDDLVAAAGVDEVALTWSDVPTATSYNAYLASEPGVTAVNYAALADGAKLKQVPNPVTIRPLTGGVAHFFVVTAVNATGESDTSNQVQATPLTPPSANASLANLILSAGALTPQFDPAVTAYDSSVPFATDSITVTATTEDAGATLTINGATATSGLPGPPLPLGEGANVVSLIVTAADGLSTFTYSITLTRQSAGNFAQQAFVKASNTGAGDAFGYALALSGDTLVVGAPFEAGNGSGESDDSTADAGAVYVFVRDNGTWSQQAYLKASNAGAGDEFGHSVALAEDTLAVGARGESSAVTGIDGNQLNNSATDSGAVYIFVRNNGIWSQHAYVKASNTGAGDLFGSSVALAGDTLAVGAPLEDSATDTINGDQLNQDAVNAGAVYVFVRDGLDNWSQQAYVKASNTDPDDRFGYQVALSAETLAVGAYNEDATSVGVNGDSSDNTGRDNGAAYVFVRDGAGVWSQQAYVKASNADLDDHFGASLALDGDTLAVGARFEDSAANTVDGDQQNNDAFNAGAAYVFVRDIAGLWSQQAYLKSANSGTPDRFGWSIALAADTLAVGASYEASASTGVNGDADDDSTAEAGAAYVFTRTAGSWSQTTYVKASNTGEEDQFAFAVAVTDNTVAIGAPFEDSNGSGVNPASNDDAEEAGAVYVQVRN